MKFNIKEFNNFVTEESHFVDGTHISKNSEKILNTAAKFIYYGSVISAIILIAFGIYAFVSCLAGAGMVIDNPFISGGDIVMTAFFGLFHYVLEGVGAFISGVIIYSLIRMFCNISLSLKKLNENQVLPQPQSGTQPVQAVSGSQKRFCEECGKPIPAGAKSCPECGCPVD